MRQLNARLLPEYLEVFGEQPQDIARMDQKLQQVEEVLFYLNAP